MINQKLIELTSNQLEDYISCPNLFYIRHVNGIVPRSKVTIRKLIEKHKEQMFYRLMEGTIPDINKILIDFSKDCMDNKYPPLHRDVHKGSSQLITFFNWLIDNRVQIADIGTPYELTFPKSNVILKGNFGAIRYTNDKLELIVADFSAKDPDQNLVDISIRYTLQAYAVHKLIKKYELACIRVLTVRYNRVTELLSYRSPTDFARLENTVDNIACAIRNNIFYPRESFECLRCPVKSYCAGVLDYVDIGAKHAD